MLSIRLSRFGKKKQPTYRIIVLENKKDPWGDYLEMLGHYNPRSKEIELKADRIKHWISKGAKPSETVYNLLVSQGVIEGKKKTVTKISKKRKTKLEGAKEKKEAPKTKAPETPADTPAETPKEKTPTDAPVEAPKEEAPAETPAPVEEQKEETRAEAPVETPTPTETPAEEEPTEAPKEEVPEEIKSEKTEEK